MALVSCGQIVTPHIFGVSAMSSNLLIDAANEMSWGTFRVSRSGGGTISHVHFRTMTVTTGATVDVRIETLSTTGTPTGTLWGTNTNGAQVIADANDNVLFRTALTAGATVVFGDTIAVMVKNPAASFGNMVIARSSGRYGSRGFPYPGGPLATDKIDNSYEQFAIEYSDGVIELPCAVMPGCFLTSSASVSTATNPDEIGLLWTQPFTARCVGFWIFMAIPSGITYRISLYQSGNDTPLATTTMDTDFATSTGEAVYTASWSSVSSGITLTAGTAYRVSFVALSATASVIYTLTAISNTVFSDMGLPGAQYTTRDRSGTTDPDAAAWTETATIRPSMGVAFDQLDNGVSSHVSSLLKGGLVCT